MLLDYAMGVGVHPMSRNFTKLFFYVFLIEMPYLCTKFSTMYSEKKLNRRRLTGSFVISTMSVTLVLLVVGLFTSLLAIAGRLSEHIKENIGFEVIFKQDTKEAAILKMQKELESKNFVKSAQYISQQEATKRLNEELGEDFTQWLGSLDNPLLPSLDVRFTATYANVDSLAKIEKMVLKNTAVKEVYYPKHLVGTINSNINSISMVFACVGIILLVMAVTLIGHTVRLQIYAKRFLVRSMLLVGATHGFIRKPFMRTAALQGIVGSALSILVLGLLIGSAVDNINGMRLLLDAGSQVATYCSVLVLGVLLTVVSARLSLNKYLNADIDKLYA